IFTVESEAFEGVKRIAKKAALDFEKVTGTLPNIAEAPSADCDLNVIFATVGKSPIADKLASGGKFDSSAVRGKREVYQIKLIDSGGAAKTLLVYGSDKRGTIYGIFALSEYIGVSPLHFWGDAEPVKNESIEINADIETISKEPSVKYRGFFINDEWPCFGNWTFDHYNGFTAEMYDHVFELLLRLKGNYLWPAMWSSSFALDGPGNLNEELADIYGVVIGASHHEPCLRASEEWDKVRGKDSIYGNEWNYYTNKNGLLKYWEDALKRSGKYEKIITIGMRGERDSSMLGSNATLKENIDLLKDIIKNQRDLIKKYVNPDIDKVPQVLALYKEVEEYFYGGDQSYLGDAAHTAGAADGLVNWDELDGVTCMLCEDNFGFMRTLPSEKIRGRRGGFGMYYHFDYHGGPVSYEWMPSISFERTWEQMSMAYDYGIKDIWIVNVGDLKFNETPLAYFMELAYDFEKWGTGSPNSIGRYTSTWLEKTFPSVNQSVREKMSFVMHSYIRMNAMRRPEALNAGIYHPCHYLEADKMLNLAAEIEKINEEIYSGKSDNALSDNDRNSYYSMIYYPAKLSVNLLRMHLYAGKNSHYAKQGKKTANKYAALVTECIEKDRALCGEFALFKNGKWKGMELEQHIGFVKWNDDNYRYPLRVQVEPAHKPRMVVSRKDREEICTKTYGKPMTIIVNDFLYAGNDEVIIEIANDGIGSLDYIIESDNNDWLEISSFKGTVEDQEEIILRCNRKRLAEKNVDGKIQSARLLVKDGVTTAAVDVKAKAINTAGLPPMTFLENNGVIVINANHFCEKKDVANGGFKELENYGRSGCGMKVFPTTSDFGENEVKPFITYRFLIEEPGDYSAEIWTTPANSVQNKRRLRFIIAQKTHGNTPHNGEQIITAVPGSFRAGNPSDKDWCKGVLDNIRVSKTQFSFQNGVQEILIGALEAGLVLEKILVYKKNDAPLESYLGPPESRMAHN
ncbi:MAG: glycosyl hydrolase 115 family protein, partial [Treponema sp.]|nr:glycosyl hydrolase 115 family protein [Treponema sp.]